MKEIGVLEILVHKKKNEVLVVKFVMKKSGSLETWFSHGNMYKFTKDEFYMKCHDIVEEVLADPQKDYQLETSEYDQMPDRKNKDFFHVSIGRYPDEIWITALNNINKDSGAVGGEFIKVKLPVGNLQFLEFLQRALEHAA